MSERIAHDPRTKQQIKDHLHQFIYAPVEHHFHKRLKDLVIANARALRSSQHGFMFRGEWFTYLPEQAPPRRKDRLVPELRLDMEQYLADRQRINHYEMPYVMGFINQVLNSSDDLQDYFQVLPEPLHRALQEMIDKCPCRTTHIKPETAEEMQERNQVPIELIKERLVKNLLLA